MLRVISLLLFVLIAGTAQAASRFWVGGSGTWDNTSTTHWSTTSGGSGGASAPTSADDVTFNASSGGGTVDASTTGGTARNVTFTSFSGSIGLNSKLNIYGNLVLSSGVSFGVSVTLTFRGATSALTTNAISLASCCTVSATSGAILTLQDDLVVDVLQASFATVNTNSKTVTARQVNNNGGTLTISSSTINVTATGINAWSNSGTVTATGSTISIPKGTFAGGGSTYNVVNITANSSSMAITGNNTFATLSIAPPSSSGTRTVTFGSGSTTTITSAFTCSGADATHTITYTSSSTSAWTISKTSGTVICDRIALANSTATGGATFNATNATDNGGNTGWNISGPVSTGLHRMFLVFP